MHEIRKSGRALTGQEAYPDNSSGISRELAAWLVVPAGVGVSPAAHHISGHQTLMCLFCLAGCFPAHVHYNSWGWTSGI